MPIYGPYAPYAGASNSTVDGIPNFSITVTGQASKTPSLSDWLFGNPIQDQMTVGIADGTMVQNKNWQDANNPNGVLRAMNKAIADAQKTIKENKQLLIAAGVFVGVIVLAKSLSGNKRR